MARERQHRRHSTIETNSPKAAARAKAGYLLRVALSELPAIPFSPRKMRIKRRIEVGIMTDGTDRQEQLQHDLANARQEKRALQGMLSKAAQQIDEFVDSNCDDRVTQDASQTASKLRRAAAS